MFLSVRVLLTVSTLKKGLIRHLEPFPCFFDAPGLVIWVWNKLHQHVIVVLHI